MRKLPKMILVVGIIRYTNRYEIVDIFKEYFNGMPYISYSGYDNKVTYYILPKNAVIIRILKSLYEYIVLIKDIDIMAYVTYVHAYDNYTSASYHAMVKRTYSKMLPPIIEIYNIDKEKLKLFI